MPRQVHFQGRLAESSGAFLPGPVILRVRLYDHPSNPTPVLFDESHPVVDLDNGLFSILIGSQTGGGVPDSALAAASVYLSVSVDGAAELAPRTVIAAAPYSVKAKGAEQLYRPGTLTPALSADAAGRVGVGTVSPDAAAILELSSTTGGFLPPRLTTGQRDAIPSPPRGLTIFNTTTNCMNMWTGTTWKQSCFECDFQPPTAGNNGPICEGSSLNLTATSILDATYQWTGPNGFTSSQQNPIIPNTPPSATGPYSVSATVAGCTSSPVTTLVTVDTQPTPPTVANNGPICVGQTLELTASTIPGAAYQWSGPNGFSSNQQNPLIVNATASAGGQYTLAVTRGACSIAPVSTMAVVNSIPAAPNSISGPSVTCFGAMGVQYTATDVPSATSYAWTVPPGSTIAGGQGTAFLTVNFNDTDGNISVNASNACGTGPSTSLFVDIQGSHGAQTFNPSGSGRTGSIQTFTVPACITALNIDAWGAQGGNGSTGAGGLGARMMGDFSVTPGATLKVLVGQRGTGRQNNGSSCEGGGGGGSYVTDISDNPLVIAGGGGGSSNDSTATHGTTSTSGDQGTGGGGAGGSGGSGGSSCCSGGAGGGGLNGDGAVSSWGSQVQGGQSFVAGGVGGDGQAGYNMHGGFGGGGASHGNCCMGGGGGGGYSGGGGGAPCRGAGGGGSFNGGSNQSNASGARSGDGLVTFTW